MKIELNDDFLDTTLDPYEISEGFGISIDTIQRWISTMRRRYPDKIFVNRDFLLDAKKNGWESLQHVDLLDYDQLALDYRDQALTGKKSEPDLGKLYTAIERGLDTYVEDKDSIYIMKRDRSFLKDLLITPVGTFVSEEKKKTMHLLNSAGLLSIHVLTNTEYNVTVTSKGKWMLLLDVLYEDRP